MTRVTSSRGRDLVESVEGLRLKAYLDGNGIPTIGYGSTGNVKMGDTITAEQADARLAADLHTAEATVNSAVRIPLNQNQFDALVSFCYNIGQGNFRASTLLKTLNSGDLDGAMNGLMMWVKVAGKFSQGLMNRRTKEKELFMEASNA